MSQQAVFRRVLTARAAPLIRTGFPAAAHHGMMRLSMRYSTALPSITQASFWESMIPKPFRRHGKRVKVKSLKKKEWNPATFFIIILLLIGSMSIQMIALKNDFAAFTRRADAKIDLLREVIQRVQNGEEVDVEGLLGTGDAEKELEWEEVLKEIEKEDELWIAARKKKPVQRAPIRGEEQASAPVVDTKPVADAPKASSTSSAAAPRGFY